MSYRSEVTFVRGVGIAAAIAALLTLSVPAQSAIVGYDNQSSFNTAISGWTSTTTNFDSAVVGTTYTTGTGPTGSGFTLALTGGSAGYNLPVIANQLWTTSGVQYLGLDNFDTALEAGDLLTFNFASAVQAFGLFVIGGRDVQSGDMRLTTNDGASVVNSGVPYLTSGVGDFAYFLGFASDNSDTFTSVTLDYANLGIGDLLPIAVDDVVLAVNDGANNGGGTVPEPGTLGLMFAGLLALGSRLRKPSI
ncbi:PEP-CTERM sorting domain-containing protein [Rhodoferax sp.]|uniref:PEP-CTERM sorting domain-containing protein n=1 Tax=Rhodoferax sp. TaxID=50421 RepID=UPI00284F7E59|nr:PEP-CTERM sorting domain-containing protein [Rhodoferax sp.]MDR3371908.1 PEP-CTERM sorting domain-containing protein [Rhodoferax sp.]